MSDWIPISIAILSFLGSIASFYLSKRERDAGALADEGNYYSGLVADLQREIERLKIERAECKEILAQHEVKINILQEAIRNK